MTNGFFLIGLFVIWTCIHAIHAILATIGAAREAKKISSQFSSSYRAWLEKHGIQLSFLTLSLTSNRIPKYFRRIAFLSPRFWRLWFSAGVFVGCFLLFVGPILILYNVFLPVFAWITSVSASTDTSHGSGIDHSVYDAPSDGSSNEGVHRPQSYSRLEMYPLIPGINVPAEHTLVFVIVILVNSMFHEAGHGIAAALHDVYIENCGIFVQFIMPGAFVTLHSPQLNAIKAFQQLRIFCAGVWHNLILALGAMAFLYLLPVLLSPSYVHGSGIVVVSVHPQSPLHSSLNKQDIITAIDKDCTIKEISDLHKCLASTMETRKLGTRGVCLSDSSTEAYPLIERNSDIHSNVDCCADHDQHQSESRLCFSREASRMYKCLPAKRAFRGAQEGRCKLNDCGASYSCWNITAETNDMFVIEVNIAAKEPVLFFGPPDELLMSIQVSNFVPLGRASLTAPLSIQIFLHYLVTLSPALAILNACPCWLLDGAYITKALLELLFPQPIYDEALVEKLRKWTLHVTAALLCTLVVVSFARILQ